MAECKTPDDTVGDCIKMVEGLLAVISDLTADELKADTDESKLQLQVSHQDTITALTSLVLGVLNVEIKALDKQKAEQEEESPPSSPFSDESNWQPSYSSWSTESLASLGRPETPCSHDVRDGVRCEVCYPTARWCRTDSDSD